MQKRWKKRKGGREEDRENAKKRIGRERSDFSQSFAQGADVCEDEKRRGREREREREEKRRAYFFFATPSGMKESRKTRTLKNAR